MKVKRLAKLLVIVVTIALLITILAGCSTSMEDPSVSTGADDSKDQEVNGGKNVATFVLDSDPSNINYHAGSGSTPENHIISATNDRLTLYNDETGEYEPMLLESWEHNEDCTEWTMHLRKGVKWHDGVEFTAHDVAFTFEYMHDPNIDGRQTTYYGDPNETIEVVDDYTYKIITDYPNPSAPLARWTTVIPKHIWEKVDPSNFSKAKEGYLTVGLGPYKMVEYKVGEYIKFEAFDDYYGGKPKIDTIYYRIIGDKTAQIAALQSGQVDCLTIDATAAEEILENPNISIWQGNSGNITHLYMNNKREPFDDINVRKAITHLVNKESLVEQAMRGFAKPADSCFAPGDFYYNPDVVIKYEFSIEKAIELLEESGYTMGSDGVMEKNGHKLEFEVIVNTAETETAVLIMAQDFIKAGIKIQPKNVERSLLLSMWDTHDFDMLISAMTMGPDPIRYRQIYDYNYDINIMQYESEKMSKLFADAASAIEENEKKEIYENIQRTKSEDAPSVELWYRDTIYAYNKDLVIDEAAPIGRAHFRFLKMHKLRFKD